MSFINKANILLLLVFIGSIAGSSIQKIPIPLKDANISQPPSLIDYMRKHYLKLEENLWELFDSGIDIAYVLEQIHVVHLKFFGERFGERNVSFNDCSVEHKFQLKVAIDEINRTVSIAINNYLHGNPLAFDERESIAMARRQLNLTKQMDELFAHSGSIDYYQTINNVSAFEHLKSIQITRCVYMLNSINSINNRFIFITRKFHVNCPNRSIDSFWNVKILYLFI